jgi:N-sulfoglucosamine sulfohydrolase
MKKLITLLLLATIIPVVSNAAIPKNILFIFMEDMGLQIGPYGDPTAPTPRLDALAEEGVVFENAHCTQPTCSPSRSSIFSGLYPHQSGHMGLAKSGGFYLKDGLDPFLKQLKEQNYYTGRSYKIHVDPEHRIQQYFDKNYDFQRFIKDGTNTHDHRKALEYMADFLNTREKGAPFFYMAQTSDTHRNFVQKNLINEPFQSLDGYKKQTAETVGPLPSFGEDIDFRFAQDVADYYNAIQRVDAFVGGCLDLLEKHGLAENTVVVFSADHGPCYGRGKLSLADFGTHVPFIVRWPGSPRKGERSEALVSLIDLPTTFVEIAGADIPSHYMGRSIRPLLQDSKADAGFRSRLITEYTTHCPIDDYAPARAIQDGRYKLIHHLLAGKIEYPPDGVHAEGCPDVYAALKSPNGTIARSTYDEFVNPPEFQLYDRQADPHEHHNLADNPEYAEILKRLQKELMQWRRETKDPFLSESYTAAFTKHVTEHQANVEQWEKDNPDKNVWKTPVMRPDMKAFIQ